MTKQKQSIILSLIFIISLTFFIINVYIPTLKKIQIDFSCYYNAGSIIKNSPLNVYEPGRTDNFKNTFNLPPITGVLCIPFTWMPKHNAKYLWTLIDLLSITLSAVILMVIFENFKIRLLIVFLIFNFQPIILNFRWGNIYNFLTFLFTIFLLLYQNKKFVLSAVIIGLLTAIKIFPGLFCVLWLIKKRYKLFFVSTITFILLNVIIIPLTGIKTIFYYYTTVLFRASNYPVFPTPNVQSFTGLFYRLFHHNGYTQCWLHSVILTKSLSLTVSLIFLLLFIFYAYKNKKDMYLNFSFCLFSIFMIHSLVWEYSLAFVFPGIIILFYSLINFAAYNKKQIILFLIIVILLSLPLPYDNKFFMKNIWILLTAPKLYAVIILWYFNKKSLTK